MGRGAVGRGRRGKGLHVSRVERRLGEEALGVGIGWGEEGFYLRRDPLDRHAVRRLFVLILTAGLAKLGFVKPRMVASRFLKYYFSGYVRVYLPPGLRVWMNASSLLRTCFKFELLGFHRLMAIVLLLVKFQN